MTSSNAKKSSGRQGAANSEDSSRFFIGIDLGTTNCALAYLDSHEESPTTRVLSVDQARDAQSRVSQATLPSFLLHQSGVEGESTTSISDSSAAGEPQWIAGMYAREASHSPALSRKVISSAKSWLSQSTIDAFSPLLPWKAHSAQLKEGHNPSGGEVEVPLLSVVQAQAEYLRTLKEAWNHHFRGLGAAGNFDRQRIVVTVPASFDESAQEATLAAARLADFPETVQLIEEPQAAFLSWLEHGEDHQALEELLAQSARMPKVVIVDVGGGTTDFSLFEVRRSNGSTPFQLRRTAVGSHLLLGGDNLDHYIAHKFSDEGKELSESQRRQLVAESRLVKEKLLASVEEVSGVGTHQGKGSLFGAVDPSADDSLLYVSLSNHGGSSLFGNTVSLSVEKSVVTEGLLQGFFPLEPSSQQSSRDENAAGLRQFGLPFAQNPEITAHLKRFLDVHADGKVDAFLCNGGTLTPPLLRKRLSHFLDEWNGSDATAVLELQNPNYFLSVARGASFYGYLQSVDRKAVQSNYAGSLFLELSSEKDSETRGNGRTSIKAVCICPFGQAAGESVVTQVPGLEARVQQPIAFHLYRSTTHRSVRAGDTLELFLEEVEALPPSATVLEVPRHIASRQFLPIALEASISETGLLTLECRAAGGGFEGEKSLSWTLTFQSRDSSQALIAEKRLAAVGNLSARVKQQTVECIAQYYGKKARRGELAESVEQLPQQLEALLGEAKEQWSVPVLRSLYDSLKKGANRRGRSVAHERVWLTLAGWCLRPGVGSALDQARVADLWKMFKEGPKHPEDARVVTGWWIMWRRVACGLSSEAQQSLMAHCLSLLKPPYKRSRGKRPGVLSARPEILRLAATLEHATQPQKKKLADLLLRELSRSSKPGTELGWALGRLGARIPLSGKLNLRVPSAEVVRWFDALESLNWSGNSWNSLRSGFVQAVQPLAGDSDPVAGDTVERLRRRLTASGAPESLTRQILVEVDLESKHDYAQQQYLEELPVGVRINTSS